ncbi:MAG: ATP-binding protein [bacterium]|nr:ATP-binding protein [bacterium]
MESATAFAPLISQRVELILGLIAFVSSTYLGLMVYLRNPNSATHRLFAVIAALIDTYIVVNYLSLHPPVATSDNQLFWIRVVMFVTSFIGPMLFLLVHTFPRDTITLRKRYLAPLLILMFLSATLAMTPLVFEKLEYISGEPIPTPGIGMPVFVLDFGGLFFWSIIWLIYKYRKTSGKEKAQLQYFLFGILFTFAIMGVASNLTVVLGKTSAFVFLGPIVPVILMAFVAASIVKHRFLDIKPVIARAVSYTLLIVILGFLYTGVLFGFTTLVLGGSVEPRVVALSVLLAGIAALTFQPVRRRIEKLTDRIFFKAQYDADALLGTLTRHMIETIDLGELAKKVLGTLIAEMRVSKAAFLLLDHHAVVGAKGVGYDEEALRQAPLDSLLHSQTIADQNIVTFEDIHNNPEGLDVLRKYDIALMIPIRVGGDEVAILALGPKRAGDLYSSKDIGLLSIFSSESGIAIQNARLYNDLKESDEMKSQFISVVSHQMRTPISAIRWSLELLQQKNLEEAKRVEFLTNAHHNAIFIAGQLDDVLTVLAIQSEKGGLQKSACEVHTLSVDIVSSLQHQIQDKHLDVKLELSGNASLILCDAKKIQKAIQVLIQNAITYTPEDGHIVIHSENRTLNGKKHFVLSVSDTGLGLTDEEKKRIFDKFFRSEEARLIAPDGMGLGMFIAETFVAQHGGTLWVESAGRGKGATFFIALPVNTDDVTIR